MISEDYVALASVGLNTTDIRVFEAIKDKKGSDDGVFMNWKELGEASGLSERQAGNIARKIKSIGLISYFVDLSAKKNYITINEIKKTEKEKSKKASKTSKTGPLSDHRMELFEKIQKEYHPNRAYIQTKSAMTAFNQECIAVSMPYKKVDAKRDAIDGMANKILEYIEHLKTTKEWEDGGQYIPGIGNMIRGGKWKVFIKRPPARKYSERDKLKSIFGS